MATSDLFGDIQKEMKRMQEEMARVFSGFSNAMALSDSGRGKEVARAPVTGLQETDTELIATFEIPGAKKDEIEVNVTESSVEVKAQQSHKKEEKGKDYYGYASYSKTFHRLLSLPSEVKPEESKASYDNGILRIAMPKTQTKQNTKKLDIN